MACSLRCGRASRNSCDTITAAAPPSEVGQHCNFVRGSWISWDFIICSRVYSSLNWEYGFLFECSWLTRAISAKSSIFAPNLTTNQHADERRRPNILTSQCILFPHFQTSALRRAHSSRLLSPSSSTHLSL